MKKLILSLILTAASFSLSFGQAEFVVSENLKVHGTITDSAGDTVTGGGGGNSVLSVNLTAIGTDADTNEKDLMSFTVPANTLNANLKAIRVTAWGITTATGGTKIFKVVFGATAIHTFTGAASNTTWNFTVLIVRDAAGSQENHSMFLLSTNIIDGENTDSAEDETGTIVLKITGKNSIGNANEILQEGMIIEVLPEP